MQWLLDAIEKVDWNIKTDYDISADSSTTVGDAIKMLRYARYIETIYVQLKDAGEPITPELVRGIYAEAQQGDLSREQRAAYRHCKEAGEIAENIKRMMKADDEKEYFVISSYNSWRRVLRRQHFHM